MPGDGVSQLHLKCIWRINRRSLKVFGVRTLHAANGEGERSTTVSKEITMTMLNNTSSYYATPAAIRRAIGFVFKGLARLINGWIAAVIAHRERQANLVVLRSLSDRDLNDMGLHRCEIGEGLAEAAKFRSRSQQPANPDAMRDA
jgi:uncharacterized protein YjiS (DUF1127 family)